jgi:hypothetical protein
LIPSPQTIRLVLDHRQDAVRTSAGQDGRNPGGDRVAVSTFVQDLQRDQSIEQNRYAAFVAFQTTGDLVNRRSAGTEGIEQIEIGGSGQNTSRLKAPGDFENPIGCPSLRHR